MTRRALVYARISEDRTGAGLGVGRQSQDCRELADRLGWTVVDTHADNDVSAYSGKPRPGYRALLSDLQSGRADAVLAWHPDRLHRRPSELEQFIEVCERHAVAVQTVKAGVVDLGTPSGRMIARMLGAASRHEVEHMIERQKRSKLQAAQDGRYRGGVRPFGYERDGVTVRDTEAVIIRELTRRVLAGESLSSLTRDLNARGILTAADRPWRNVGLVSVLTRARNAGLVEHDGEVVGPARWPAIIDEDVWRAIRAVLTDPTRRTTPGPSPRHLLAGLALCGVCGSTVRSITRPGRPGEGSHPGYRCRANAHMTRTAAPVEEFVRLVVAERLGRPDVADLLAADAPGQDTDALRADAGALRVRLDELAGLHAEGAVTARQLAEGSRRIRERLADTERLLARATAGSVLAGVADAPDPAKAWLVAPLGKQRAVLDRLMVVTLHAPGRGRLPDDERYRLPSGALLNPDTVEITPREPA